MTDGSNFTLVKEGQGMETVQFLSVFVMDSGDNVPTLSSHPIASFLLSAFVPLLVSRWAWRMWLTAVAF